MQGRHISIQGGNLMRERTSDSSERRYVCIVAWEKAGKTNKEACVTVAEQFKLFERSRTRRGRRKRPSRGKRVPNDVAQAVRSGYHSVKRRIPWKTLPSDRDPFYEKWLWCFAHYKRWVAQWFLQPLAEGKSGAEFAKDSTRCHPSLKECMNLLKEPHVKAILDESTRDLVFSPNVALSLAEPRVTAFLREFFQEWGKF